MLSLCERRGDLPESARVLVRWTALQDTVRQGQARQRRHLRRAYERAREQALSRILIYPSA